MSEELLILSYTALTIGFLHTLLGPDHYIPFIVMAKAGNWSKKKTIWITIVSGLGHVLGSIILGVIGLAIGGTIVRKVGDGLMDKAWTDAWAYYFGASYALNNAHRFEFYAVGAPQRHGQNLWRQNIGAYDAEFAKSLGLGVVYLTDKYMNNDPPSVDELKLLEDEILLNISKEIFPFRELEISFFFNK